jgi:hypothetical protein
MMPRVSSPAATVIQVTLSQTRAVHPSKIQTGGMHMLGYDLLFRKDAVAHAALVIGIWFFAVLLIL